jgi:hypothetical protein
MTRQLLYDLALIQPGVSAAQSPKPKTGTIPVSAFRSLSSVFLLPVLCLLASAPSVQAACSNPAGNAGDIMYNSASHVPQFCNGTNWHAMGPRGAGGSGCGVGPVNGLVGWWKFDETSGTSAADATGNGNTGTLSASNATWTAGEINNTVSLSNTNTTSGGLVNLANPSNFAFEITNAFTLAAWIFHSNSNTRESDIFGKQNPASSWQGYSFWIPASGADCGNNCLEATFSTGSASHTVGLLSNTLSANTWHHVVETYDGSSNTSGVKMYIDGVSQTINSGGGAALSTSILVSKPLQIGGDGDGDGTTDKGCCTFNGLIDDARVYNRALSAAEVAWLYGATNTSYPPSGSEGDIMYNSAFHVLQFCDGKNWSAMGPAGTGGAGCSGPTANEGDLIYNSDYSAMQYCDGAVWRAME